MTPLMPEGRPSLMCQYQELTPSRPVPPRAFRDDLSPGGSARLDSCADSVWRRISWLMTYIEIIRQWKALSPERKLQLRWEAIPLNVARSMAFEGEPVPVEAIRAILDQIEPPALLKRHLASSAIQS